MSRFGIKLMLLLAALAAVGSPGAEAQKLSSGDSRIDEAFQLALRTLDSNTHDGLIHAGAGYGGEWTRDAAINCWNAASLLRPQTAEKTLWSVTDDGFRIKHQYWDKIIWTIAAWNHYCVTGDEGFLREAYYCASHTMSELEDSCYERNYGLFMGPAVFQDGIAGYDEPVYDPAKWDDSFVLHHKYALTIKCLSTNIIYCQSYNVLSMMAAELGDTAAPRYRQCAERLKESIVKHFYNKDGGKLYYLLDHRGVPHEYQEGMGTAFALLFDILAPAEAERLMDSLYISPHGIPAVYPSFPRNTPDKPGRHNMMVWPHVNMLFASGCARHGRLDMFDFEMQNLAELALSHDGGNFYEIYTLEGEPSGGWQCGALWGKMSHQTWCATGFLRLILNNVFGLTPTAAGLELHPVGMAGGYRCKLSGIRWRDAEISITVRGHGTNIASCKVNGIDSKALIPADAKGRMDIVVTLVNSE